MLRPLSHLFAAAGPLRPGAAPRLGTPRCLSLVEGAGAGGGRDAPRQKPDRTGKETLILAEQVKQLYALAPIGFLATLVNSIIVFLVMKTVISYQVLVFWLVSIMVITAGRLFLVMRFQQQKPQPEEASSWENRFVGSLIMAGAAWGSIGFFPLAYSIAHQVFIAFVLGGMAAGAASTFSNAKYGYAAFALPAMLPFAIRFLLVGDQFHYAMAAMTLLYIVLLWRISQHNCYMNRTSFLLRFENLEMVESLRNAKEAVEGLNLQLVEEIKAKLEAEAELRVHHEQLEKAVDERTADLKAAQQGLVAAKVAAERGNRAKSEFLANMSHEMRTPLAGVLGMIQLVLNMEISDEERELLEMAKRSADSLLRIIADVLDFSRLEAGVMRFECKPFSIAEVVRAAVEVVSLSASQKGLELVWHVERDLPEEMEGDAGRVRQVLVNLLGNAVKFTERGRITVNARTFRETGDSADRFLLFSVEDTGIGIAADRLEMIFGKFTQIDASLTKRHGGTGLGLALSRQIVEKMGGRIWVESQPAAGSTFCFTIPCLQRPESGSS